MLRRSFKVIKSGNKAGGGEDDEFAWALKTTMPNVAQHSKKSFFRVANSAILFLPPPADTFSLKDFGCF